jgi:hypothetical protein
MKKFALGWLLAVLGVLAIPVLTFAIGNPVSVSIPEYYIFTSVLTAGDQLWFARYNINFSPVPNETASTTWQMAVYASNGSLVATRHLNYYQENIISLYLTPAQALNPALAHTIRIMGMPSVYANITEGVNMKTISVSPGDFLAGTLLHSKMVAVARTLEIDWAVTLLTVNNQLNTLGTTYFTAAIQGLGTMTPALLVTSQYYPSATYPNWTENYTASLKAHQGSNLQNAINGTLQIFRGEQIGGEGWGAAWFMGIIFMMVGGPIFAATKRPDWAIIIAFPIMLGAAWLGIGTEDFLRGLLVIVLIVAVVFALVFWLRNMG